MLLSYPWENFEVNYSDEKSFREAIIEQIINHIFAPTCKGN